MATKQRVSQEDLEKEVWCIKDSMEQPAIWLDSNWDGIGLSPIGDVNDGRECTWGPPDFPLMLRVSRVGNSVRHCFTLSDYFYISEAFKAIIEMHEPNVHKYIPVAINSKTESVQYYILHVMGLVDGVVIERSIGNWDDPAIFENLARPRFCINGLDDCIAYSSKALGKNKMWRDKRYITKRRIFITGQLKGDLAALKRHNIEFTRVNVVDADVFDTTSLVR